MFVEVPTSFDGPKVPHCSISNFKQLSSEAICASGATKLKYVGSCSSGRGASTQSKSFVCRLTTHSVISDITRSTSWLPQLHGGDSTWTHQLLVCSAGNLLHRVRLIIDRSICQTASPSHSHSPLICLRVSHVSFSRSGPGA